MLMPVKIFFCYAHEDEPLLNKLKTHLRPLQRAGLVDVWHDRDISAGSEWQQEIKQHLNLANIILLLVSPDFMDSDYCYSIEMKYAIERHDRGEVQVIPIILRPVYWQEAPFGKLQALPKDAKPVTGSIWRNIDAALFDVIEGVKKVAKELVETSSSPETKQKLLLASELLSTHDRLQYSPTIDTGDILSVNLGHLGNVVLKLGQYTSLKSLLDDLYMKHLKDHYRPYTYGLDWILYSQESDRLIVSWSWFLKFMKVSLSTFDPAWASSPPEAYGLIPGTKLEILNKPLMKSYGVATNDNYIASLLIQEDSKKERYALSLLLKQMMSNLRFPKLSYTGKFMYGDEICIDLCLPEMLGSDVNEYKFRFAFRHNVTTQFDRLAFVVKSYSQRL